MSVRGAFHITRLTHLPTGVSVQTGPWSPSPSYAAVARKQLAYCRSLLAANLYRNSPPSDRLVRSYHLNPPLGIEPFIGHGRGHGREIAVGADACERVLRGELPLPIRQEAKP